MSSLALNQATLLAAAALVLIGCTTRPAASPETEAVKQQFGGYTVERAQAEGYQRDPFCLSATDFGQPANLGAMGFHATDESRLRGPIEARRPQALMFDADGKVLGVEYEVTTDAVREPPQLFGRTFTRLPPHPGVEHEHYALHLWFIDNPAGQVADFNPRVTCPGNNPPGPAPGHAPGH